MSYSTFENSGDDLQHNRKELERTWHFGRAYVCHKGGFQHQHVSENDFRRCNGDLEEQRRKAKQDERDKELQDRRKQREREAMTTKQKEEHEKYLKDKDLQIAAEKTKLEQIRASSERDLVEQRRQAKQDDKDKILRIKELELQASRTHCERDDMKTKRDEEHEKNLKYLKDKDLEIAAEKRKTEEIRAKAERDMVEPRRQAMQMKHDHEIKLKELEMEQQTKFAELEERKIKVEENKANNMKDLLAILKPKRPRSYHGAIDSRLCEMSQLHLDIDPSTSSIKITSDNDAVPSAINRYLF